MTARRILIARIIAIVADLIQVPEFLAIFASAGVAGAVMVVTDLIVAAALMYLLGWNWILLPSLIAEQIPGLNLLPTWTATVVWLTRKGPSSPQLETPTDRTKR